MEAGPSAVRAGRSKIEAGPRVVRAGRRRVGCRVESGESMVERGCGGCRRGKRNQVRNVNVVASVCNTPMPAVSFTLTLIWLCD